MYIILAHRILIFYDKVGNQRSRWEFGTMSFFELVEPAAKNINEHGTDGVFVVEEVELFDDMGDDKA